MLNKYLSREGRRKEIHMISRKALHSLSREQLTKQPSALSFLQLPIQVSLTSLTVSLPDSRSTLFRLHQWNACLHFWKFTAWRFLGRGLTVFLRDFCLWFSRTDSMTGFINLRWALHFFFPVAEKGGSLGWLRIWGTSFQSCKSWSEQEAALDASGNSPESDEYSW